VTVASIPVSNPPTSTGTLTSFEAPSNAGDNYGQRVLGYITPTTSGNYTFWIAADDNCELWLSTNDNPANKVRIAWHNGWTNSREWGKFASQRSSAISLNAGTRYYIEALMKEGGGGDNLAVAWRLNNSTTPANGDGSFIIPGSVLSTWNGSSGGGATTPAAPSNLGATAVSASQINLTWTDNANNETAYKVERATSASGPWTELVGNLAAGTTSYSATGLSASTTYHFRVRASNSAGNSAYSNTASATTQASGGGSTNVALNKPASASTSENGNTPGRANDGNTGTRWAASNDAMPQWWEVDLGAAHDVTSSEIVFEGASAWRYRVEGRATTSDAWTTLVDRTNNSTNAQTFTDNLASGTNKRYIRVTITGYTGGYWWASLWEIRIFGTQSTGGGGLAVAAETYDPAEAKSPVTHRVFTEATASGGSCAVLESNATGQFVTYAVPNVTPGTYTIYVRHKRANNRASIQVATADTLGGTYTNRGSPIDAYAASMDYVENTAGTVTFSSSGTKFFRFTASGKNAASSSFWMAIDRIRLQP
jgi:hypothetical protein